MCVSPRFIDNPYKGLESIGLNRFHDCHSLKIAVPCGHCHSCIALRQSYFIQRSQMESLENHLFMLTLTYQTKYIPRVQVNGRTLYYPDFTDVQRMFKRLRNKGYEFSYLVVSEYGTDNHRPHFHALISIPKGSTKTYHDIMNMERQYHDVFLREWRRNYGSDRKPLYKDLCKYIVTSRGSTYDFHYVDPHISPNGEDDCSFYVTKYVLKADKWVDRLKSALKLNLLPDEFEKIWKLLKPRCCVSKGFGSWSDESVKKHIRKGIDFALADRDALFPYFIHPSTGQTFPLAPYYKKRFLKLSDLEVFFKRSPYSDGFIEAVDNDINRDKIKESKLARIRSKVYDKLLNPNFYDEEITNLSEKSLEEDIDFSCFPSYSPDDWTNDFYD